MKPFLKSLASAFVTEASLEELSNFCFIFPNRRSGLFFKKHLTEISNGSILIPHITTISDFTCDITNKIEASRIELLFMLYDEYRNCIFDSITDRDAAESTIASFDQFIFWGDMILSDFNDVDKYLANAEAVFENVKDLNSIKSNYVDDELSELLLKYFNLNTEYYKNSKEEFWQHINNDTESGLKSKFIKFWEILWPLYNRFTERLKAENKAYSGMLYKETVECLKNIGPEDLTYKKYIFVGFSMLSKSEYAIFKLLDKKHVADFYWDFNSKLFDKGNKGAMFVARYNAEFKSQLDINQSSSDETPNINIISIPSNTGQAKHINNILEDLLLKNAIKDKDNAIDTAIVLPDENLFIPALSSIRKDFSKVNITMGYPMRFTSAATLMKTISMLQNRARKESDGWAFFHEDIKNVLTHPFIQKYFATGIEDFLDEIENKNLFTVKEEQFSRFKEISCIFKPVEKLDNRNEVFSYFNTVIDILSKPIENNAKELEYNIFNQYRVSLNQLEDIISNYDYDLKGKSFMYLIERTLASSTITFQGEPLSGLQIMGVLETRCLDFDNIIILSMNEKMFPRKHFSKSFIPNNLRKGHGLATTEYQESIYTYYFYRMLSRAKNAYLVYDSRTSGIGSGEPSRYIYQLRYLYKDKVRELNFQNGAYTIKIQKNPEISITKNERIYSEIKRFSSYTTDDQKRYLSASSINEYVKCPFSFYLNKIEKIKVDDEITDFVDGATMGKVVHQVMQNLYALNTIDEPTIDSFINKFELNVSKHIVHAINEHILNKGKDCNDNLEGNTLLIYSIVENYIRIILEHDKDLCPIQIIQLESPEKNTWDFGNGLSINFTQIIDRIDKVNNDASTLRIVDYKTGSDDVSFNDIDLFSDKNNSKKAIRQIYMYCNFYTYLHRNAGKLKPVIYDIKKSRKFAITYKKNEIKNITDPINNDNINSIFIEGLINVLSELFNKDIPFYQTKNTDNCEYCNFKNICHR